jgi:hypothetical protein
MFKRAALLFLSLSLAAAGKGLAQGSLFYLEAQGLAGYSSAQKGLIFYSMSQTEAMQKPSLGFDYVQRFSKATGDFAVLAIQGRLAWNAEDGGRLEPQLYNAYVRFKFSFADLWAGHNRPALGLSSVFDTHAHLLQTLAMDGYGYDRDWGLGFSRDLARGNWSLSLTTGSGMPLHFRGNFLFSGRMAFGVLSRDNWSLGLSGAYGKALETMGYEVVSLEPRPLRLAVADFSFFWNNLENRLEAIAGRKYGEDALAVFWRLGVNFLEENRLKWEIQPILKKEGGETMLDISTGVTYLATGDLALRIMYAYDREIKDSRVVFQIYYYRRIIF